MKDDQPPQFNSIQLKLMIKALEKYLEYLEESYVYEDPYREVIRHLINRFKKELDK